MRHPGSHGNTELAHDNDPGSFFATKENGNYPWVIIELLKKSKVDRIMIINRGWCDAPENCNARLRSLEIRVGSNPNVKVNKDGYITQNYFCQSYFGPAGAGEEIRITCKSPIIGNYVTLQLHSRDTVLNFAEVEVYGQGKHHNNFSD